MTGFRVISLTVKNMLKLMALLRPREFLYHSFNMEFWELLSRTFVYSVIKPYI